LKALKYEMSYK